MIKVIKIQPLFVYSPEYEYTHSRFPRRVKIDNRIMYQQAMNILRTNVNPNLYCFENKPVLHAVYEDLQKINGVHYDALNKEQMQNLVNNYAKGLGQFKIKNLRNMHKTTVLILLVRLMNGACNKKILLLPPTLDGPVKNADESVLIIGRECQINFVFNIQGKELRFHEKILDFNSTIMPTMLAHGFGHLLGCHHTLDEEGEIKGSAHGHKAFSISDESEYGTIMSRDAKNIVPFYSAPVMGVYPFPFDRVEAGNEQTCNARLQVENNIERLAGIFPDSE